MARIIAWFFVLMAPFLIGFLPCIVVARYYSLDIPWTFGAYCLIWLTLFGCWFDNLEYQDLL